MKRLYLTAGILTLWLNLALAEDSEVPTDFIRYHDERSEGGPEALETATVSYSNSETGVVVDLVSVVHVGDTIYYQQLAADLTVYDAVYYELVGGEKEKAAVSEARQHKSERGFSGGSRSAVDRAIRYLGLSYQADWIDYEALNFVHADVSWRELYDLMQVRNESLQSLFARTESGSRDGLYAAATGSLTGGDPRATKRAMAKEFGKAEALMKSVEADGGTSLVADRNVRVMKKIQSDLVSKSQTVGTPLRLAIFYGAGHMPDFEERLRGLGFVRDSVTWRRAWSITD